MRLLFRRAVLPCVLALCLPAGRAAAQAFLADEIILLSKGATAREKERAHQHLGTPGAVETRFPATPGGPGPRLGESAFVAPRPDPLRGVGQPEEGRAAPSGVAHIAQPPAPPGPRPPAPGPLEAPGREDEGPPGGLTLDQAVELLVQRNYDLLVKFQEIPKADADILSAGLRLNPLVFASADNLPYNRYSPQRPGEEVYSVTLIQPIDINQKRLDRIRVAEGAKKVLEAQYQNAVRLEIDNLYAAFLDLLQARETARYTRASLALLEETLKTTRGLVERGVQPATELDRVAIQRNSAEAALLAAEASLRQSKQTLAALLDLPPEQADCLEVRGTLREEGTAAPCVQDLTRIALAARPDLNAYRLGVERARADVQLAKAERVPDIYLLATPFNYQDNSALGARSASSWGVGVMTALPVFNRNQGNIRRAEVNAAQTQLEQAGLERQVIAEVQRAAVDYSASRAMVQRFEQDTLERARKLRDAQYQLFLRGQAGFNVYLEAQREYADTLRQYLDALLRHRRSMLRLNTVVGQRVVP